MILTFDIETLPCVDSDVIERLKNAIKPPATFKKQESIDKWYAENLESEVDNVINKTSLDGAYGRIACIGFAYNDNEVLCTDHDQSESEVIQEFYDYLYDLPVNTLFCGHYITGFDLPFLKHRSIINGIEPPSCILKAMNAKPWDDCIADTKLMWAQDKSRQLSLDTMCFVLGIDGKGDFDGSMVAETWLKDPLKVIEYCKNDVRITREVYKRLTFKNPF